MLRSKLSTLTKSKEKGIDPFHPRILRTGCINIRQLIKEVNGKVYETAKVKVWSVTMKIYQMKCFRHLMRLLDNIPWQK